MSSSSRAASFAANTVRFAPLRLAVRPVQAVNDNGDDRQNDALLRAALRLFAEHGLGAGHRAQAQAENAFFSGDRERYRWWLAITRTLDRKLAVELAGRMGSDRFGSRSLPAG
jgi:hypothetical protein